MNCILKGRWFSLTMFDMGSGNKLNKQQTKPFLTGGLAIMQAGTNHFGWTNEETLVQLYGTGPWGVTYVNAADEPRKK